MTGRNLSGVRGGAGLRRNTVSPYSPNRYYWRVRPYDGRADTTTNWSPTFRFSTQRPYPDLLTPARNAKETHKVWTADSLRQVSARRASLPHWLDSNLLAYVSDKDVVLTNGSSENVLFSIGGKDRVPLGWSACHELLVAETGPDFRKNREFLYALDGSVEELQLHYSWGHKWSGDGRGLIYLTGPETWHGVWTATNMLIFNRDALRSRPAFPYFPFSQIAPGKAPNAVSWSPSRAFALAYHCYEGCGYPYVFGLRSGTYASLSNTRITISSSVWSPSGDRLAFGSKGGVHLWTERMGDRLLVSLAQTEGWEYCMAPVALTWLDDDLCLSMKAVSLSGALRLPYSPATSSGRPWNCLPLGAITDINYPSHRTARRSRSLGVHMVCGSRPTPPLDAVTP